MLNTKKPTMTLQEIEEEIQEITKEQEKLSRDIKWLSKEMDNRLPEIEKEMRKCFWWLIFAFLLIYIAT